MEKAWLMIMQRHRALIRCSWVSATSFLYALANKGESSSLGLVPPCDNISRVAIARYAWPLAAHPCRFGQATDSHSSGVLSACSSQDYKECEDGYLRSCEALHVFACQPEPPPLEGLRNRPPTCHRYLGCGTLEAARCDLGAWANQHCNEAAVPSLPILLHQSLIQDLPVRPSLK